MAEQGPLPETLLFDVGGVLVELGPHPLPAEYQIPIDACIESKVADKFERGKIDREAFARGIISEFGIDADAGALLEHFRLWPTAPFPGVLDLLACLRNCFSIAILSNTNELHWRRFEEEFGLLACCDRAFGSHLIGLMKPEAEIFSHVCEALDAAPEKILFFDDNEANVAAARAGGMQAELVRGFEGIIDALVARGIVDTAGEVLVPEQVRWNR